MSIKKSVSRVSSPTSSSAFAPSVPSMRASSSSPTPPGIGPAWSRTVTSLGQRTIKSIRQVRRHARDNLPAQEGQDSPDSGHGLRPRRDRDRTRFGPGDLRRRTHTGNGRSFRDRLRHHHNSPIGTDVEARLALRTLRRVDGRHALHQTDRARWAPVLTCTATGTSIGINVHHLHPLLP